jgi:carboxymethylenebutenolidase
VVGSYGQGPLPDGRQRRRPAGARPDHARIDHDIKVYPDAGHGFINNHDPADATLLLTVLSKVSGTRYHEPSARDAHRRIAAFLHRHLTT